MFPHILKRCARAALLASILAGLSTGSARAEMVLSQVIVDMKPGAPEVQDIEIWNDGGERIYVAVDPARIERPGKSDEKRSVLADPAALGLLVTPQRIVLEPNQRRTVRIAAIQERGPEDAVYRLAIRPVAGALESSSSALKILVGYDALVLIRPNQIIGEVSGVRRGRVVTFYNGSNTAQEIYDGKQCVGKKPDCRALPAKRLYAGASWSVDLPLDGPAEFAVMNGRASRHLVVP